MLASMAEQESSKEKVEDQTEDKCIQAFEILSDQINTRLTRSMELNHKSVFQSLRNYFTELIEARPVVQSSLKEKVSNLGLNTNLMERNRRSPKDAKISKRRSPALKEKSVSQGYDEINGVESGSLPQSRKHNMDILGDIKQKLKLYEKTRRENQSIPTEESQQLPVRVPQAMQQYNQRPIRDSIEYSHLDRQENYPREEVYNNQGYPRTLQPRQSRDKGGFSRQHRTVDTNQPKIYNLYDEPQRKISNDSSNIRMAYERRYEKEAEENSDGFIEDYKPSTTRRRVTPDYVQGGRSLIQGYIPTNSKGQSTRLQAGNFLSTPKESYAAQTYIRREQSSGLRTPVQQNYLAPVAVSGQSVGRRRVGIPFFDGQNMQTTPKNSQWYFDSMKTINDLKNIRDDVRSKLTLAQTPTASNRPVAMSSKYFSPRYGLY